MNREIERRFLVREAGFLTGRRGEPILLGYVAKQPGRMLALVRLCSGCAFLTLKNPRYGPSPQEFEYEIPVEDARCMLDGYCPSRLIRKTRYPVPFADRVFAVDVFEGRHAGLIIAEAELPRETTAVALPPWLGVEITSDSRYGNFALAHFEGPVIPAE